MTDNGEQQKPAEMQPPNYKKSHMCYWTEPFNDKWYIKHKLLW